MTDEEVDTKIRALEVAIVDLQSHNGSLQDWDDYINIQLTTLMDIVTCPTCRHEGSVNTISSIERQGFGGVIIAEVECPRCSRVGQAEFEISFGRVEWRQQQEEEEEARDAHV